MTRNHDLIVFGLICSILVHDYDAPTKKYLVLTSAFVVLTNVVCVVFVRLPAVERGS